MRKVQRLVVRRRIQVSPKWSATIRVEDIVPTVMKMTEVKNCTFLTTKSNDLVISIFLIFLIMLKEIPFSPGFFINEKGIVYDKFNKPKKLYKNSSGYLTVCLKVNNFIFLYLNSKNKDFLQNYLISTGIE